MLEIVESNKFEVLREAAKRLAGKLSKIREDWESLKEGEVGNVVSDVKEEAERALSGCGPDQVRWMLSGTNKFFLKLQRGLGWSGGETVVGVKKTEELLKGYVDALMEFADAGVELVLAGEDVVEVYEDLFSACYSEVGGADVANVFTDLPVAFCERIGRRCEGMVGEGKGLPISVYKQFFGDLGKCLRGVEVANRNLKNFCDGWGKDGFDGLGFSLYDLIYSYLSDLNFNEFRENTKKCVFGANKSEGFDVDSDLFEEFFQKFVVLVLGVFVKAVEDFKKESALK